MKSLQTLRFFSQHLLFAATASLLVACGGGGGSTYETIAVPASIELFAGSLLEINGRDGMGVSA